MAQAARDYLAIPSSEADIERLFSLGRGYFKDTALFDGYGYDVDPGFIKGCFESDRG